MSDDFDQMLWLVEQERECKIARNDVAEFLSGLAENDTARELFRRILDRKVNEQRNAESFERARINSGKSAVELHREFVETTKRTA